MLSEGMRQYSPCQNEEILLVIPSNKMLLELSFIFRANSSYPYYSLDDFATILILPSLDIVAAKMLTIYKSLA